MGVFRQIKGYEVSGRWPRLGKIHLGVRKRTDKGVEYPAEVPHFVFEETPAGRAATKLYGATPKVLDVALPAPDIHDCAPLAFKKYAANALVCTGDGETYRRWGRLDQDKGKWLSDGTESSGACPSPEACPFARDARGKVVCKATMNLYVILYRVSVAGVFQIDTGSWHSHQGIFSGARFLQERFPLRPIHQVPLKLARVPQEIEYEGKRSTHWILQLRLPNHDEIQALIEGLYRTQIAVEAALGSPRLMLGAGATADPLPRAALPEPARTEVEEDLFPQATERLTAGGAVEANGGVPDDVDPATGEVIEPATQPAEPEKPKSRLAARIEDGQAGTGESAASQAPAPAASQAAPEAPPADPAKPKRTRKPKEEPTAAPAPAAPAAAPAPLPVTPGPSPDDPQYSFD